VALNTSMHVVILNVTKYRIRPSLWDGKRVAIRLDREKQNIIVLLMEQAIIELTCKKIWECQRARCRCRQGSTENDGHENDGHETAGPESARHEIAGPENARLTSF